MKPVKWITLQLQCSQIGLFKCEYPKGHRDTQHNDSQNNDITSCDTQRYCKN